MLLDEKAKEWLAAHRWELEPEEIVPEEEIQRRAFEEIDYEKDLLTGSWPTPDISCGAGFESAGTQDGFIATASNPANWKRILDSPGLYYKWILPNAVLLFGKPWFNKAKWRSRMCTSIPFPLFSTEERGWADESGVSLESTPAGKAKIAKIVSKMSDALRMYLSGEWYDGTAIKNPAGYLINSIRNGFAREIGTDMGYKLVHVPACPYCLLARSKYRVPLTYHGSNVYSCPRCRAMLESSGSERVLSGNTETMECHQDGSEFYGMTCVCPSDGCAGRFVPLTLSENNLIDRICREYATGKGTTSFRLPPAEIMDLPLRCPFCKTRFTPRKALDLKTGFKQRSGYLTGLPTIQIWQDRTGAGGTDDLDEFLPVQNGFTAMSEGALGVIFEQRIRVLVGELVIRMSRLDTRCLADLHTWCFYSAAIQWMREYREDAAQYFFGCTNGERTMTVREKELHPGKDRCRVTMTVRGRDVAVHQSFFQTWMDLLERNIDLFARLDPAIDDLGSFGWFCRPPKYTGGPVSEFVSEIGGRMKIPNRTKVRLVNSQNNTPRLARILSIHKMVDGVPDRSYNYVSDVRLCEWHAVRLSPDSRLKIGDQVVVRALVMPGHHTHAPIQRMLRLRKDTLGGIIAKVAEEEKTGTSDAAYWASWKDAVRKAQRLIDAKVKE